MLASRIQRFGGPEVIELTDLARPAAGKGEVLVRVAAAGVGPWDAWVRSGKSIIEQPLPLTLGSDISGRIAAVGPEVHGFLPGQEVYGVTNERFTGGYAEYAVASANSIALKPHRLSFVEAASLPVAAVTAQQMLFDHAQLQPGEQVLIHGVGGSVGSFALQMARGVGAHIVGTDRGPGAEYASPAARRHGNLSTRARYDRRAASTVRACRRRFTAHSGGRRLAALRSSGRS